MSSTAKRIRFSCAVFAERFEPATDPKVLRQYRRYPYVRKPDDE